MFSKCLQPICHYLSMDSEVVTARCRRGDKGSRISTLTVQVTSGAVVPPLIHGNLFGCGASLRTTCIEGLLPTRVDLFSFVPLDVVLIVPSYSICLTECLHRKSLQDIFIWSDATICGCIPLVASSIRRWLLPVLLCVCQLKDAKSCVSTEVARHWLDIGNRTALMAEWLITLSCSNAGDIVPMWGRSCLCGTYVWQKRV